MEVGYGRGDGPWCLGQGAHHLSTSMHVCNSTLAWRSGEGNTEPSSAASPRSQGGMIAEMFARLRSACINTHTLCNIRTHSLILMLTRHL